MEQTEEPELGPGEDPVGLGAPYPDPLEKKDRNRSERFAEERDMTRWGTQKYYKTPHAAKGLQLVNVDNLADLQDLEIFRASLENDLKTNIDDREQETKERVNKQMKDHAKKQNDTLDHRFDN